MSRRIRVLVADDQLISREGIRRILERENDMVIVGTVSSASEVLPQIREKGPDVVLLDLRWHHDDQAMGDAIVQLHERYPRICIIGLTAYERLMKWARALGAKWVITKDVDKKELLCLIRAAYAAIAEAVTPEQLDEARSALKHLRGLETGQLYAADYERDVHLVLKAALHPHLTNSRSQVRNISRTRRRDILFSNYSLHPFWQHVRQKYDAVQVVFEVKNCKRVEGRYVDQVAGYLKPGLGRLGFLVSRALPGMSVLQRAVEELQTKRKVILFLCDDDLEVMLKLKENEGEPTVLIRERYDDFVTL